MLSFSLLQLLEMSNFGREYQTRQKIIHKLPVKTCYLIKKILKGYDPLVLFPEKLLNLVLGMVDMLDAG